LCRQDFIFVDYLGSILVSVIANLGAVSVSMVRGTGKKVKSLYTSGHAVAQLVEALRYKPERRGLDSQWCHCNFLLT
jgi:hypothetical protein